MLIGTNSLGLATARKYQEHWYYLTSLGISSPGLPRIRNQQVVGSNPTGGSKKSPINLWLFHERKFRRPAPPAL